MRTLNKSEKSTHNHWTVYLQKYFLLIALLMIAVIFGVMQPKFFNLNNIMDIMRTASIIGFMACGTMIIMGAGELNFAMGAQLTMTAGIIGRIMDKAPESAYIGAILIALIVVTISGLVAGFFVINIGVPSFIATLALQTLLSGFNKLLTDNTTYYSSNWGPSYTFLGQGFLFKVIPMPFVIFAVVAFGTHLYYEHTMTGRYICAVGSNLTASKQVGLNISLIKYKTFMISSIFAGLAGLFQTSISKSCSLSAGHELLMPAICTTMLGATFLKPGKYNVQGTVVASILMIMIENGVVSAGGSFYEKNLIQGLILIVAVGFIAMVRKEGLPKVSFGN